MVHIFTLAIKALFKRVMVFYTIYTLLSLLSIMYLSLSLISAGLADDKTLHWELICYIKDTIELLDGVTLRSILIIPIMVSLADLATYSNKSKQTFLGDLARMVGFKIGDVEK